MKQTLTIDERGQAYTFEAFTVAIILATALYTALQITAAAAPIPTNTATDHNELGLNILQVTDHDESLTNTLLAWNTTSQTFVNATDNGYTKPEHTPTKLNNTIEEAFHNTNLTANINATIEHANGTTETLQILHQGTPNNNARTNQYPVTLYDNHELTHGPEAGTELTNTNEFYVNDTDQDSKTYAVIIIEITVWNTGDQP